MTPEALPGSRQQSWLTAKDTPFELVRWSIAESKRLEYGN